MTLADELETLEVKVPQAPGFAATALRIPQGTVTYTPPVRNRVGLEGASPTTVRHRGYKLRAELRPHGRETQRKPQLTMTTAGTRQLPAYDELPKFKDFSGCAWEVWGKDDQLGTINLLTDDVVKEASKEIKYVDYLELYRSPQATKLMILGPGRRSA